jgi:hypothetical protein
VGRLLALLGVAAALAATPVSFVQSHRTPDGGYAENGSAADPALTAWAVLGLRAAGADAPGALSFLQGREDQLVQTSDVALAALAEAALGTRSAALLARLHADERPTGAIGPALNSTYWAVLALGEASKQTVRFILAHQTAAGGFGWAVGGRADSNDTAAALEALAVARVRGAPVSHAVRFLLSFQNKDGGFELTRGRGSDAQSTAWAIQGLVAAGRTPPRSAFAYLARLRRSDGSYRYSSRYVTTPVWVTSQVMAALARKPFPLATASP